MPSEEEIGKEEVFLTREQARKEIFSNTNRFETKTCRLEPAQVADFEKRSGWPILEKEFEFDVAIDAAKKIHGYALVLDEKGKYRPITLMVGLKPDFHVEDVEIMVYRESRGGEVRRRRFLSQYQGKSEHDSVRVNRDIINVTGATVSAHAVSSAVRRAVFVTRACFGKNEKQ